MEFKTFEHLVLKIQIAAKKDQAIYDLGVDLTNIIDDYHGIINTALKAHYGVIGEEMISWWLYEDTDKFLYDSKTKEVVNDLTLLEGLWKYIEELRLDKDFIPYVVPEPMTDEERLAIFKQMFS